MHKNERWRGIGQQIFSAVVLLCVCAFVVGVSLPRAAIGGVEPPGTAETEPGEAIVTKGQQVTIEGDAPVLAAERENFEVTTRAQLLREQYQTPSNFAYGVNWSGSVRWPFPYFVPITDGYGPRDAPCAGCSTFHYAIDLVPGAGTPIYAIADGVVIDHEDGNASWGNYVKIEHRIGDSVVISSYAHMETGSSPLVIGESIRVGEFIGLVGATGQVTAPHLHLEIEVDGVRVDPFVWLSSNTAQ